MVALTAAVAVAKGRKGRRFEVVVVVVVVVVDVEVHASGGRVGGHDSGDYDDVTSSAASCCRPLLGGACC